MKNKIKSVFCICLSVLMLTSCGKSKKSDKSSDEKTVTKISDPAEKATNSETQKPDSTKKSDSDKKAEASDESTKKNNDASTENTETSGEADVTHTEMDKDTADKMAHELFDAAQSVADQYSTAGGTIMANIIKSSDINSAEAEKINICNFINSKFDSKNGIWAIELNKFEIVSAVYSPYADSGVIGRYPDTYSDTPDKISEDNIDSYLG